MSPPAPPPPAATLSYDEPPPPPPATTTARALLIPSGTVHPPAEVRYERGNETTTSLPAYDVDFTSRYNGVPTAVMLVPAPGDGAVLFTVVLVTLLKSYCATRPVVEDGVWACIPAAMSASVRAVDHRRKWSIRPAK